MTDLFVISKSTTEGHDTKSTQRDSNRVVIPIKERGATFSEDKDRLWLLCLDRSSLARNAAKMCMSIAASC